MRVLITGGAGFIGSHLCDRALAEGHEVVAVDSLITGDRANIAHLADNPAFRFIQHDVTRFITFEEDARRGVSSGFAGQPGRLSQAAHPDA